MSAQHSNRLMIRPIRKEDNAKIAAIIRAVLSEFGFGKGSSAGDPHLDNLTQYYQDESQNGAYLVVSDTDGNLFGGGGFARVVGSHPDEHICELQKFYLVPSVRQQGYGKELLDLILTMAIEKDYVIAYLETAAKLDSSIKLYQSYGFTSCAPKGNSGHQVVCDISMQLELKTVSK